MEDSVEDGTEGGYTAYPAGHPEAYRDYYRRNRWGVRMPDGDLHYGLSQGDAENLEVITGGQLVAWVNDGWEDVSDDEG